MPLQRQTEGKPKWSELRVGFVPQRSVCEATPGWRHLPIGFPFFHPPIRVATLPPPPAAAVGVGGVEPSLLCLPSLRIELPHSLEEGTMDRSFGEGGGEGEGSERERGRDSEEGIERGGRSESEGGSDWDEERERASERGQEESGGREGGTEGERAIALAAIELEAVEELRRAGDWRAARALRRLLPAVRSHFDAELLADEGDGEEWGGEGAGREGEGGGERGRGREGEEGGGGMREASLPWWIGGERPLLYLAREGFEACALCVIASLPQPPSPLLHGAEACDPDSFTPLHFAASLRQPRLCAALLGLGCWVEARTADLACRRGHFALASHLSHLHSSADVGGSGGEAHQVPTEQELRGFELVEVLAVRERSRRRRSMEGRGLLHQPFVTAGLLSGGRCRNLIAAAEKVGRLSGWQSARHPHHATVDIPLDSIPSSHYAALRSLLEGSVLPTIRARYETAELRLREVFVVKYEAEGGQASLGMHRDGTLLNCVVLLSHPSEFEGGEV
ncbi:MAG: hypothetical protein SGPRY_006631 [Prymnesium sp.]